jgi:hypothetical protein
MLGLYDIRNKRGVGHAGGDVNPNQMDATVILYEAKWLVAELVRLLHSLTTDEATAIVDALLQREVAWVWSNDDVKRILRLGLTCRQQTLVLLLSEAGPLAVADLVRWLEHPRVGDYRKVLRLLHKERRVEFGEAMVRIVHLLPRGSRPQRYSWPAYKRLHLSREAEARRPCDQPSLPFLCTREAWLQ